MLYLTPSFQVSSQDSSLVGVPAGEFHILPVRPGVHLPHVREGVVCAIVSNGALLGCHGFVINLTCAHCYIESTNIGQGTREPPVVARYTARCVSCVLRPARSRTNCPKS